MNMYVFFLYFFYTFFPIMQFSNFLLFLQIRNKTIELPSTILNDIGNIDSSVILEVTNIPQINTHDNTIITDESSENVHCIETKKTCKESHKENLIVQTLKFDLNNILSESAYGKSLLLIKEHEGNISSQCQSILCDIIVSYFLNLNIRYL